MIILYIVEKHFCRYSLEAFSTEKMIKRHIKGCLKINGKQKIIMPKRGKFKHHEKKTKSPFITYADFESILVQKDNGKQNADESYRNQYQKHMACSYGYKLVSVDDKFRKSFKTYFRKDSEHNFINSMIKESKYYSDVVKKHLNKELVITKEDNEEFKNFTKC